MTMYEFVQTAVKHRRGLLASFGVLVVVVLVMSFTFESGGIAWRGTEKWESVTQIAVLAPGDTELGSAQTSDSLENEANFYAALLGTEEATAGVQDALGSELLESLDSSVSRGTSLISVTVIAGSFDEATQAGVESFRWLERKLTTPLVIVDPSPEREVDTSYVLQGSFASALSIALDADLASLADPLFLAVVADDSEQATLDVQANAGFTRQVAAVLRPTTTLLLTLQSADGEVLDTVRTAPPPPPTVVQANPLLAVDLGAGSIERITVEDERTYALNPEDIQATWIEGTPVVPAADPEVTAAQIALVTEDAQAIQIGGRRGPIVAAAAIVVGVLLLLTAIVVMGAWEREKEAAGVVANPEERGGDAASGQDDRDRAQRDSSSADMSAEDVQTEAPGAPIPSAETDQAQNSATGKQTKSAQQTKRTSAQQTKQTKSAQQTKQ